MCLWIDVLDEFQQTSSPKHAPELAAPSTHESEAQDDHAEAPLSDDFVQELTKNMESFMAQLGQNAPEKRSAPSGDAATGGKDQALAEEEMMKQFERMLSGGGAGAKEGASEGAPARDAPPSDASFQDVIQATMEKLRQSNADANANAKSDTGNPLAGLGLDGNTDLAQMLEALGGAGEGGDMSELSKMLSSMMEDLMNKDVLYEPLKDMHARFPAYFDSDEGKKLSEEERKRYKEQEAIMGDIVAVFEEKSYSDQNPEMKRRVSDLVTQMQERGSPPQALLGDMPPELSGLNNMLGGAESDENCSIM